MKDLNQTVIGSFESREEAVNEIQRLHNEGYTQSQINVYSNPTRARTVERLLGVKVEDVDVDTDTTGGDEDLSWWDTIKDSFNFFVYDADQGDNRIRSVDKADRSDLSPEFRASLTGMKDILSPYEKDLRDGKLVIVVDNYRNHSHA